MAHEQQQPIPPREDHNTGWNWKDDEGAQKKIRTAFESAGLGKPKNSLRRGIRIILIKILEAFNKSGLGP